MNINQEIKNLIKKSSLLNKLIIANIAVFLLINIIYLFLYLFNADPNTSQNIISWLAVPADLKKLVFRFWTPFTYMFLHEDFWHIFGNMLWLFFLGRLFIDFIEQKKLFAVYILGGLSGAALYILSYNVFPVFFDVKEYSLALGASASVSAIVIAISAYQPNFQIRLFGLLSLKLKWLAIIFVLIDLISIPNGNAGGHIAHLGGAMLGFYFAIQLKKGKDITRGFNKLMDNLTSLFSANKKPEMKITYNRKNAPTVKATTSNIPKSDSEYNKTKSDEQAEIDRILDKISQSGYESLSSKEKEFLFKFSKK